MADYDTLIDELIKTKPKRQQWLEKTPLFAKTSGLVGGTALETSELSAAQLLAVAETKLVDRDFLATLSLKDKDLPDVLTGKYDPEAAFKLAYEAMGNSLSTTITDVLNAVQQCAFDVENYWPEILDWKLRNDTSTDAFREYILVMESANIETNAAYTTLRGQLANIAAQIEALTGLPTDITPQVAAVYKLSNAFDALTGGGEFHELFTLRARKHDTLGQYPRPAGAIVTTKHTGPLSQLSDLIKAKKGSKTNRRRYWAQWVQVIDGLDMALDALELYINFGFAISRQITTEVRTPVPGFWGFGRETKRMVKSTLDTHLGRQLSRMQTRVSTARDQLTIAIEGALSADPRVEATKRVAEFTALPAPPRVGTTPDEHAKEIQENKKYLDDVRDVIKIHYSTF
jgi:hypothetical protein